MKATLKVIFYFPSCLLFSFSLSCSLVQPKERIRNQKQRTREQSERRYPSAPPSMNQLGVPTEFLTSSTEISLFVDQHTTSCWYLERRDGMLMIDVSTSRVHDSDSSVMPVLKELHIACWTSRTPWNYELLIQLDLLIMFKMTLQFLTIYQPTHFYQSYTRFFTRIVWFSLRQG